ncbi:MAG: hypothetical protein ABI878_03795 [Acidobacteriota bacterium]
MKASDETDGVPIVVDDDSFVTDDTSVMSVRAAYVTYLLVPAALLTVTLLGGIRLAEVDNAFRFLRPALICLVFAVILLVLFVRGHLIELSGWFSEELSVLQNLANACVLITLFTASTQIFNSLLPEGGLPFWIVGFCFFWTLWNDLFLDFDARRLLRSLGGLLALGFFVKYLLLQNLTAPSSENWLKAIFENPAKEAFTLVLDLPRYSSLTGYLQFFTVGLFLLGLFLIPRTTKR